VTDEIGRCAARSRFAQALKSSDDKATIVMENNKLLNELNFIKQEVNRLYVDVNMRNAHVIRLQTEIKRLGGDPHKIL
jgi:hypothetical protein